MSADFRKDLWPAVFGVAVAAWVFLFPFGRVFFPVLAAGIVVGWFVRLAAGWFR